MATARPFAYNTGAGITGTDQVGSLAVGTPTSGFASTGLPWWNGPDEDLGYVIARSVPGNSQPVPVGTGATGASVGFFRSSSLTEPSFISIANYVAGPSGPFASGSAAKSWLNDNGYWTSYIGGGTGATGGGYELVILPYQPPAAGDVIFPTFATPGLNQGTTDPNGFATGGVYWNAVDINSVDQSSYYNGLIGNSATISFTQNGNTAIYSATNTAIVFDGLTGGQAYNYNPNARPGQLTLTQSSPSNFVVGQTVYISFT